MAAPDDHFNFCDDLGMKAIDLLNIEMIDIRGCIEIDIRNRSLEAGPFTDHSTVLIIVDDLRDI